MPGKLFFIAVDTEGHQITLGTKTIIVDNVNAVKPFGAIDTPTQGGTASGSSFINWGWVLTPQPDRIPTDGSTIHVMVDGVNIGHPNYNIYKEGIATLFPDYANNGGAGGYFYLDTTVYENGIHTIHWTAIDDGGNSDGIGSRYFSIQNTNSGNAAAKSTSPSWSSPLASASVARSQCQWSEVRDTFSSLPIDDTTPIFFKKSYNHDDEPQKMYPDDNKTYNIQIRELEPLEIKFSEEVLDISGYHVFGNQLKRLPIGSTLNKKTKTFHWIPGPGFFGEFRFVFIKKDNNGEIKKKFVSITIEPKYRYKILPPL